MKAIILNDNNALILEISEAKDESNGNLFNITTCGANIITSSVDTLIIDGNEEVVKNITESLVGEGATITYYNPSKKEKKVFQKKNGKTRTLSNPNLNN